jgi:predicted nuclease with TOPRIM domain
MNERELLQLKKDIEESKQKVSELKGEKQALMKQLKEDWNCSTLDEANEKLKEMQQKAEEMEQEIEQETMELEHKLEDYGT